jgi:hypothetical protein
MKHWSSYTLFAVLGLVSCGAISCAGGDDDAASPPGGSSGSGGTGGSAGSSTGGAPGPGWAGLACTKPGASDPLNCSSANKNIPACTMIPSTTCSSTSQCQLQLLTAAKCADGHVRACTVGGQPGVLLCDTLPTTKPRCDWKACVACGGPSQPCCLGGCKTGYSCSALTGGTCQ